MNITVSNWIHIVWNVSLFENFKKQCFIENPKFIKAKKQNSKTNNIVQHLPFFEEINENEIIFTRGLLDKILLFLDSNSIKYTVNYQYQENEKIDYLIWKIKQLRRYQIPLEQELSKSDNGFVIVPTWWGKTVVMINEIVKNKSKTMVMITNKKLLNQFIARLKTFTNIKAEDIWIFWDKKKEIKPITIVLVQSFSKLKPKEIQDITSTFDLFFLDESHHVIADTILKVCKNVKSKRFYWLTATPEKQNWAANLFLENITWKMLYRVTEKELELDEVILKPDLYPVVNQYSKVNDFYNDFFKFEDRKINKFYINEILSANNFDYNQLFPSDNSESTLIIWKTKEEIYEFYNNKLPQNLKQETKILLSSIFKRNQNVLEKNKIVIAFDLPEQYRKVDMNKIKKSIFFNSNRTNLITNIIYHEFVNNKNKDPNILILSDRVDHLEYMYNNLPEKIKKYSTLLHAKLKKKEIEEIELKIESKEFRVILATQQYVWEGWDVSHLDTLIMSYTLVDHELLKQLVWRVIRSKDWKNFAQIYDIVDINNPITLSQFKKRFYNYYKTYVNFNQSEINWIINYKIPLS